MGKVPKQGYINMSQEQDEIKPTTFELQNNYSTLLSLEEPQIVLEDQWKMSVLHVLSDPV